MRKFLLFLSMILVVVFVSRPVLANGESVYVLGGNLSATQKSDVLKQLGYQNGENVLTVSSKEIEELSSQSIQGDGKGAYSSVKLQLNDKGIQVNTQNVNMITPRMYKQVLLTAGITSGIVDVTAPAGVSGTSAVVGIMKGYEALTNKPIPKPLKKVVFKEIALSMTLNEAIGEERTFLLLKEIKTKMSEQPGLTDEQVKQLVQETGSKEGIPQGIVEQLKQLNVEMKNSGVNWIQVKEELASEAPVSKLPTETVKKETPAVVAPIKEERLSETASFSLWKIAVVFLFFVAVYTIGGYLLWKIRKNPMKRIEKYTGDIKVTAEETVKEKKGFTFKQSLKKLNRLRNVKKLERALSEANLAVKAEEVFIVQCMYLLLAVFILILSKASWFAFVVVIVAGLTVPSAFIKWKRNRRMKKVPRQLLQALGILSNSIRAGYSFNQALQSVANEMPDPLGTEFKRAVQDLMYNGDLEEIFKELLQRLPSKELEIVLDAVLIQQTSGGNIGQLLDTIEDVIRERIRLQEEVNAITAQGRLSSWVITMLPVGLGLYFNLVNPEYFAPMLDTLLGKVTLAFMGMMILVGWLVIRKLIRIEV